MADAYTEQYREACFQAWYSGGRPTKISKILELLPDVDGNRPSRGMLGRWLNETWMLRADELDAKAVELADNHLIIEKAEMLKAQAQMGKELQIRGMNHLKERGFDSSSAAVSAVIRGADLERLARGVGELIIKLSKMTDEDLHDEIMNRLQLLSDDTALDAEVKEDESDTESTESDD